MTFAQPTQPTPPANVVHDLSVPEPTYEQWQIINLFEAGDPLVIEAGAGTGKTSTLRMLGNTRPSERGLYVAYNKAIQTDAEGSFPRNVSCRTAHSLAFRSHGRPMAARLNGPRIPSREVARILNFARWVDVGGHIVQPAQLARLTMETIGRFCSSAQPSIEPWMVPDVPGLDDAVARNQLAELILPVAQQAWDDDLTQPSGRLRYTHDCYLKQWALSQPVIADDFILFDEAQDANPVIADVIMRQAGHAQLVFVGDRQQAIYGWRGAVDAMSAFYGTRLRLSQSFRFGPDIAEEANKWLAVLGAELRLTGFDKTESRVQRATYGSFPFEADVILCRTNAKAVAEAMAAMQGGLKAALVGGGQDIYRLANAALQLQTTGHTEHPELFAFTSWDEVREYADESDGADLKVFVKLVDGHGPAQLMTAIEQLADERSADVVMSTAHKAKGREWGHVRIADDFPEPNEQDGELPDRGESMLAYVAVTRAKRLLDNTGLTWVDRWT